VTPDESVDLLVDMLEIESFSGREAALARFLSGRMARAGLTATVDAAGNAVGSRQGDGKARYDVVLLGHMDTVPGWIPVRREGDLLHGRGAVDAKGPLAAFVAAAATAELPPGVRVTVVGAVEEESASSRGARHFAECMRPDACIIGEPSGWDSITLGYKGRLLADYRVERASSHSAGPDASVAEHAVDWWNGVRAHRDAFNAGRDRVFDQLQCSLRDVRTSSDGRTDLAFATVGFRLPPGLDIESLENAVSELAHTGSVRFRAAERAVSSDRTTPLARPFLGAIRRAGGNPRFKTKTGTSDMNVVGPRWRCPIVAYGPGDSRLDHTPEEHISIAEYLSAVDILRDVLAALPAHAADERTSL